MAISKVKYEQREAFRKEYEQLKQFLVYHESPEGQMSPEGQISGIFKLVAADPTQNGNQRETIERIGDYHFEVAVGSRRIATWDKRYHSRRIRQIRPPDNKSRRSLFQSPFGRRKTDRNRLGIDNGYLTPSGIDEYIALMSYIALGDEAKYYNTVEELFMGLTPKKVGTYFKGKYAAGNSIPLRLLLIINNQEITSKFGKSLKKVIDQREKNRDYSGPVENLAEIILFADQAKGEQFIQEMNAKGKGLHTPEHYSRKREELFKELKDLETRLSNILNGNQGM